MAATVTVESSLFLMAESGEASRICVTYDGVKGTFKLLSVLFVQEMQNRRGGGDLSPVALLSSQCNQKGAQAKGETSELGL